MISVVDGEFQLKDDLWSLAKPNLDTVDIVACQNHLRSNLMFRMSQMSSTVAEKEKCDIDLQYLLFSPTMEVYEERKAKLTEQGALLMTDPVLSPYFEKQQPGSSSGA